MRRFDPSEAEHALCTGHHDSVPVLNGIVGSGKAERGSILPVESGGGLIFATVGTVLIDELVTLHVSISSPSSRSGSGSNTPASHSSTPQLSFDDLPSSLANMNAKSSASRLAALTRAGQDSSPFGPKREELIGGGGLWAVQGARIWLPAQSCKALVDVSQRESTPRRGLPASGSEEVEVDLSAEQEQELERMASGSWDYLEGGDHKMLRARIMYEGDVRRFQALVKPVPRPFASISATALHGAQYLHVSPPYSPKAMLQLLDEMDAVYGEAKGKEKWRPRIVFEPTPPACHPEQREYLEQCCGRLSVLSHFEAKRFRPNHEELLCLFSREPIPLSSPDLAPAIEGIIYHLLLIGIGPDGSGSIVVRCGKLGSVVGTRERGIKWFPPYWQSQDAGKVVDVTGAGNAYLGGLIAGLSVSGDDPYEAALYGTISSSYAVQQKGLPSRTPGLDVGGERSKGALEKEEAWNGQLPSERLNILRARCGL